MPRIDYRCHLFLSKFDLAKGFHQVPVCLEDRPKTSFVTPWGKYQYRYIMPFGLQNAPAVLQRLMDIVLANVLTFSRAYIDDIVVFISSWDEHCFHLTLVLRKLSGASLKLKPFKCDCGVATCSFLGFIIGQGQRRPEVSKIAVLKSLPRPPS